MNHQAEQLKVEITAKDQALVKEHFDHQKVENNMSKEKRVEQNEKILEANVETTTPKMRNS